ncbi:D-aminoacylase domain protein [Beutenbergia cavernae DSM 12333]|uniref:D-aminoacylase domain protein n=1 Tax=Beutenbergia cavernae (strain ATCC BAA-8 / DSM 12333 / CCUG 43141 / JCM 11478 / NBRC 16432 / NCIMB 13614 / HKI 0122) TaxID=471853 RepID=C5BZP5_BEUC1|nr:amidohydrolase family protein [Beutenbergia cavernae]ACQ81225.1 D-aminoacylase domain protein [Beutenbergia cavernae DSM 12333]
MTATLLLSGGIVVAGPDSVPGRSDLLVRDGVVVEIGPALDAPGAHRVDCTGRVVMPGFVDAHSHADGVAHTEDVQLANLRQGVTTVITGQDGVGQAPGDGTYADSYFGALNGANPRYRGDGIAGLLASYDGSGSLNVGYLVPAGTVRHEVLGLERRSPTAHELQRMIELVELGMRQGALGLSTGLDYVPGIFADAVELAALCGPVARHDGVHVSHMRGGYEQAAPLGIAELRTIADLSGVRTHVSHFHGPAQLIRSLMAAFAAASEVTFDAYPYRRGCTLLAMPLVPPELLERGPDAVAEHLRDPELRAALVSSYGPVIAERPDMATTWAERTTLVHVADAKHAWVAGLTLADAAVRLGRHPLDLAYDLLGRSALQVSAVIATPVQRDVDELASIFTDPRHAAGSDGIYVGAHPHPRGWGTFARFLGRYTRDRGDYDLPTAAAHLSTTAARAFRLGRRGRIAPGWVADLAVIDLARVQDAADYGNPRQAALGIDDVVVAGAHVLADGRLTGIPAGRGVRRERREARTR